MRIEIEIPKEFEEHFKQDKFKDSFERIIEDIKRSVKSRDCSYAGRYEYETIEMLEKAFENSRQAYPVDKVVEELESFAKLAEDRWTNGTSKYAYQEHKCWVKAIEIVKQGCVGKDVE